MASYLVTGGCGFIGSHLVDSLLTDNHKVRILDNLSTGSPRYSSQTIEFVQGDITDYRTVVECMENMSGCFHLAAVTPTTKEENEPWGDAHRVNLAGSINILDAARKNKTPVVYASSAAVYGDNADTPLTLNSKLNPFTVYGADKLVVEKHARIASLNYGIPTTGLRMFNIYGPRQQPTSQYSNIISNFFESLLRHKSLIVDGDGEQTSDFTFISDAIRHLRKAMECIKPFPALFNVCSGKSVTMNSLAQTILSISGKNLPVEHLKSREKNIFLSAGDGEHSRRILGVKPEVPLQEGLKRLFDNDLYRY